MMPDPEDVLDDLRCSFEDRYEPDEEEQPLPATILGAALSSGVIAGACGAPPATPNTPEPGEEG